jgi:hypothetical protein
VFCFGKYTEDSLKSNNNLSKFNKLFSNFGKLPSDSGSLSAGAVESPAAEAALHLQIGD